MVANRLVSAGRGSCALIARDGFIVGIFTERDYLAALNVCDEEDECVVELEELERRTVELIASSVSAFATSDLLIVEPSCSRDSEALQRKYEARLGGVASHAQQGAEQDALAAAAGASALAVPQASANPQRFPLMIDFSETDQIFRALVQDILVIIAYRGAWVLADDAIGLDWDINLAVFVCAVPAIWWLRGPGAFVRSEIDDEDDEDERDDEVSVGGMRRAGTASVTPPRPREQDPTSTPDATRAAGPTEPPAAKSRSAKRRGRRLRRARIRILD
ncbi:hypothetical protein KFE25_002565 [Diacronema lutheri]|uniref:Uncharacterized protein n=2 Tax=Diacronema lutheri TaxID=2081491 RepID=A0A8J6C972_DIALT|nr:hypothetical protein KFE25_002565 [Diacronema lutheri]